MCKFGFGRGQEPNLTVFNPPRRTVRFFFYSIENVILTTALIVFSSDEVSLIP